MFGIIKAGAEKSRRIRAKWRREHWIHQLRAGTVVHFHGIPVRLRYDTDVQTHPENWSLITEETSDDDSA